MNISKKTIVVTIFILVSIYTFYGIDASDYITNENKKNASDEISKKYNNTSEIKLSSDKASFMYEELEYVDIENYNLIKNIYNKIDFSSHYIKGNEKHYDNYIKKYYSLINSESTFINKSNTLAEDEIYYFNELKHNFNDKEVISNLTYYYFDIDGDQEPELVVSEIAGLMYCFDYNKDTSKYYLLDILPTTHFILGTLKLGYYQGNTGAHYGFVYLDKNLNWYEHYKFYSNNYLNEKTNSINEIYMISLPESYIDGKIVTDTSLFDEKYLYYEEFGSIYIRVTKEQFNELTKDFLELYEISQKNIEEVKFKYNELFD